MKREARVVSLDEEGGSKRPPYPKRKVAIMMGYCGTNYQGMQLNPNAKTIELELFNALCKDGLVSAENAIDPKKISWMRACRTDKGVHALGQVVSLKMLIKTDLASKGEEGQQAESLNDDAEKYALEETVKRLNNLLPEDVRIFGIKRTANSFHAKEQCDSRFYEYLMPTYALANVDPDPYLNPVKRPFEDKPVAIEMKKGEDSDEEAFQVELQEGKEESQWISNLTEEEMKLMKEYRINDEKLEIMKSLLSKYIGTKHFHNFTIGMSSSDVRCKRHLFDIKLGRPFVQGGLEWISIIFHGQSFMLHQIRKMVGLVIMSMRLNCNEEIFQHCLQPTVKVNIPKAPALGLLLDQGIFKGYNKRFENVRETIDFAEYDGVRGELKARLVYPKIYEEEAKFNRFMGWIKCNDNHASEFPFFLPFINSNDKIE